MKRTVLIILYFFCTSGIIAQTIISGTVIDPDGIPILGANVYLEGTYDGATTGIDGTFSFETTETTAQILTVSFVSFETYTFYAPVKQLQDLTISLKEDVNSLDAVVLSAGSFEAGDNSKVSVLKPLDIVTTASALGDFVGALQTLPGTATVAEDGRLFVRGGDASETQIFIDGLRVFTPYTPTAANTPTRGRYSPFLFDGITFSTGGYSAEYGQALSSILQLNTINEPDQEKTEISATAIGAGLGNTQKWGNASLSVNGSYTNLAPYFSIFSNRNEFEKPFESIAAESVFRYKTNNGLFKAYAAFDTTNFAITIDDINVVEGIDFSLKNNNFYSNVNYAHVLEKGWSYYVGASHTIATNDTTIDAINLQGLQQATHVKATVKKRFSNKIKVQAGVEHFITDYTEDFDTSFAQGTVGFDNQLSVGFAEADIVFSKKLALKAGLRASYSDILKEATLAPRTSLAYKTGKNSQLSLAYGSFHQEPENEFLKYSTNFNQAQSNHFIANYQYTANDRIFRLEAFHKTYDNLITFDTAMPTFESNFASNGDGYATGIDLFYRDNKTIKNLDYWVSYSYLDSERIFRNFPEAATPNFANTHNASLVTRYWINDLKSQVGISYQFASGRTYTNPNTTGFLNQNTKAFNTISVNWAYLISPQKILYFSMNNVTNFKNINGYQYANTSDAMGNFNRRALRPAWDQFFFVGFFWTISDDGKDNQLNNL